MLLRDGVLYASESQEVVSRDGAKAPWMLDTLSVSMTLRGAELAGRCLLRLLSRFEGRQIATYGTTGIPLLQSCVLQSGGKYSGLLVRKERKAHGSRKLVEGKYDRGEPVILLDDSVSSGTSVTEGTARLEEAGLRVEGAVCLVRFGWYGGFGLMLERGYHMEAVFDIWDDFIANMPDEERPASNPSKVFPSFTWSDPAPEGLHPTALARKVMEEFLSSGKVPRPPSRLDASYDSAGGAWVSVRDREDIHLRHARDGFWHFPGEPRGAAPEDVVAAAVRTADQLRALPEGRALLSRSAVAVTLFSALEECGVGDLDNDRYGIVVRSRERRAWMGGALPRMPGISNEWTQFEHARKANARLVRCEPYQLLRHQVLKLVEPGAEWQPSGAPARADQLPWDQDADRGGRLARRALDLVRAALLGQPAGSEPLPADLVPRTVDSIYVSIYRHGRLYGCMGSTLRGQPLDACIQELCGLALQDSRFQDRLSAADAGAVAVEVSVLHDPLELGEMSPEEVMDRVRLGEQALLAYQGSRSGLLLPFVVVHDNLGRDRYAWEVIDKAGITRPPYRWCRFDTATWLAGPEGLCRIERGLPVAGPPEPVERAVPRLAALMADYLLRHRRDDGIPYTRYAPFSNALSEGMDLARFAHWVWTMTRAHRSLGRADLGEAANKALQLLLQYLGEDEGGRAWLKHEAEDAPSISEVAFLLLALCERPGDPATPARARALAATLWSSIDLHGRFATHRNATAPDSYQDYLPGQALLALGCAARAGLTAVDGSKLARAVSFYTHRFRYRRDWGQVSWLAQAFAVWSGVTKDAALADRAFEIADWALGFQNKKTGGFLNDHQSDTPGYTTGVYLEAVAAARELASTRGDAERRRRYDAACERGVAFLDRLVYQDRDRVLLPNPAWAVGGVRASLDASEVRIDFVQHALAALLGLGGGLNP
ncbi:MAG TPA: AMMECR1 domain-containing protein [Myxococcales bacterium]|nr:AMMECR1 domain-containing protein [Myxococcales bacterium]